MEFLVLHKIVLLIFANCSQELTTFPDERGIFISSECNKRISLSAIKICDLKKDDFETCDYKLKQEQGNE